MHAGELLAELRKARKWSQKELALATNIHPIVINQIEHGHRLLSSEYLSRIEDAHIFAPDEVLQLREQAARDQARAKFKIDTIGQFQDPFVEIEDMLVTSHDLRRQGSRLSFTLLGGMIDKLEKLRYQYPSYGERIDRLLGKVIVEKLQTIIWTAPERNIETMTREDLSYLARVQYALRNDPEDYDMARIFPTRIRYTTNRLEDCATRMQQLLGKVTSAEVKSICVWVITNAPVLLASQGKLKRTVAIDQFQRGEEIAHITLANISEPSARASIHTGLSYGRGLLGLPYQASLSEARREYQPLLRSDGSRAVNEAQFARTELSNLIHDREADPYTVLDRVQQDMPIFDKYSYRRYREQITRHLYTHKHPKLHEYGKSLLVVH